MNLRNKKKPQRKTKLQAAGRTPLNTYYRGAPGNGVPSPFLNSPVKRGIRRFILGFLDIIILMILIIVLIYSLLLKPEPKLIVSSTSYHQISAYQAYANELFSSIGNRNKLTFNETKLSDNLKKRFPEIQTASVELPFFDQKPTLRLVISKPNLRLQSGNQLYVVAGDGVVAAKAADITGSGRLTRILDQSGFQAAVGRPVLSSSDVDFINTLVSETRRANVPLADMVLPAAAEEIDLHTTDQPYFVKFFLGGDALLQTGQYLASRHHFQQSGTPPSEYLDVRVSGKIFYK